MQQKKEHAEEESRFYARLADRYNMPAWIRLDKRLIEEYYNRYVSTWIMLTFGKMLYEKGHPDGDEYREKVVSLGIDMTPGEYWRWQVEENFGIKEPEDDDDE